jgi:hypothetical protein
MLVRCVRDCATLVRDAPSILYKTRDQANIFCISFVSLFITVKRCLHMKCLLSLENGGWFFKLRFKFRAFTCIFISPFPFRGEFKLFILLYRATKHIYDWVVWCCVCHNIHSCFWKYFHVPYQKIEVSCCGLLDYRIVTSSSWIWRQCAHRYVGTHPSV